MRRVRIPVGLKCSVLGCLIEKKRHKMVQLGTQLGLLDPEVLMLSQELDKLILAEMKHQLEMKKPTA